MTLHPIAVVDRVIEEYRGYLRTEFRARDQDLRRALEEALSQRNFLAQEPFFQAHRPFKTGKAWSALGLDAELAKVMRQRSGSAHAYLHQSESIEHLLGPSAGPLAVTTGTGSGKTECFLLPVIQDAIEDAARFKRRGLTAILVYPMNALATDQLERIEQLLEQSGHGHVNVRRYDRSTKEEERQAMRRNPPHVLLTNYVMLEYLLVRAADREDLFANHRCRFVVLDEVHSYRGALGANIAFLLRRLQAHLSHARQDWNADDATDARRFPKPIIVATSATIKSVDEAGRSKDEVRRLRDESVQQFLATLTSLAPSSIRVLGEEIQDVKVPEEARWPAAPVTVGPPDPHNEESVRTALAALAGGNARGSWAELAAHCAILWQLADLLAKRPMSVSQIVEELRATVPQRANAEPEALRREVETALAAGAALPDDVPGMLRLRTHRFVRGGWRFHRCVDADCGKLYPMGQERCDCGRETAPLYVCRNCGADALRFRSEPPDDPTAAALHPWGERGDDGEWLLYDLGAVEDEEDDELADVVQVRERPVLHGSFDPRTCSFSTDKASYPRKVVLGPGRSRCLVCGGTAGSRPVLTEVSLGTSAAVRVVAEGLTEALADENAGHEGHDDKERLLIFADSRQDAAHQARFISYAGRYDRMRRRLFDLLAPTAPLTITDAVQRLMAMGVEKHDNPHTEGYDDANYLGAAVQSRAKAWEEAPLLDDLALSAGYRATVFNLGLIGVQYQHLETYIDQRGTDLAQQLGISTRDLRHICRCLLDDMRRRGALSRPMLCYHPGSPNCPEEFRDAADWERRVKQPSGFVCDHNGQPMLYMDLSAIPDGLRANNFWRRPKAGGRGPSLERKLRHLLKRFGGIEPTEDHMAALIVLLMGGPKFVLPVKLHGFRKTRNLLQVNADNLLLAPLDEKSRFRCTVCNERVPWSAPGLPCPACRGDMQLVPDSELASNRYVQRIQRAAFKPLYAGEHTAQLTADQRLDLEDRFKSATSPLNVLACSPTLELGIDVGGLDAVVMRNVPPRPDNYAQRGGRAGRRSRVGLVLAYARSTPHDGYFFDKPREMIAGEIAVPTVGLANRDVLRRHLSAILFGIADPPLASRMSDYVTIQGELKVEAIDALIYGLEQKIDTAAATAWTAFGAELLTAIGIASPDALKAEYATVTDATRKVFDRTRLQVLRLREAMTRWYQLGSGKYQALNAATLINRLLGISEKGEKGADADDRSAGHPLRRFAEFGILPGYEFPNEPCTLRLVGDGAEDQPITVERRFGIAQYQPEAPVHARGHRWRVVGLDMASPWNPKEPTPSWVYVRCKGCELRYSAQDHAKCPRCGSTDLACNADGLPGYEFGGFVAVRNDSPVLEEEDRFPPRTLVFCHPQHNGDVTGRYRLENGWRLQVRRSEEIRWVNEFRPPLAGDDARPQLLFGERRGFYLCPCCGRSLTLPDGGNSRQKGRRRAVRGDRDDPFGHAPGCEQLGQPPKPLAIVARSMATTLRLLVYLPADYDKNDRDYLSWGHSLGAALRAGMRHLYMLSGDEVEVELEAPWEEKPRDSARRVGSITFIDAAVGGTGFLDRAAREIHLVARSAIEHLDHPNCETACYRCLKSYQNQRHHDVLDWPRIMPDLEALAERAPAPLQAEQGDVDDSKDWLEAYAAGVGSPLELTFLRLFEKHQLAVDKQVPVMANHGEAAISIADFVPIGSRVAIYVDGAAFHIGERRRRDRFIRDRLRTGNLGWKVLELRAADLKRGAEVVAEIRATI